MASKILRRSGRAVTEYCNLIEFTPQLVCLVGVGVHHQEVDCMREAWKDLEVYGFEPHPDTFKSIKDDFPGILFPYAISNITQISVLFSKSKHKDGASLFQKINKEDRDLCDKWDVQTMMLDTHFANRFIENRNGLLWLDCEGSEFSALQGGRSFIDGNISVVNVEMTGKPRSEGWSKPLDVHACLTGMGFLHVWCHTTRSVIGQVDCIYVRKEIFKPEYCGIPHSIAEYEEWNQE